VETTTVPVSELAARLRLAIARTARRLRQHAGPGLSPTLTAALATVERHGPLTPSELATREQVRRPTATKVIARLEAEGLVARTGDPDDRRSSLIAATRAGRALLREARTRKAAYLAEWLDTLAPEDRATLERAAALLERLLDERERP
jgi:DNA-binding MarR family transcriptional regulator